MKGCSLAGPAGFHGLNTGTPDGGGLGFLLKLLLTAESLGNGFIFDSPITAFLSLSHKPFGQQVIDQLLLLSIHPASQDDEIQMPGLQDEVHCLTHLVIGRVSDHQVGEPVVPLQ